MNKLHTIVEALQRVAGVTPIVMPSTMARQAPIKELRRYGASKFLRLKGVDLSMAKMWLESITRIYNNLNARKV